MRQLTENEIKTAKEIFDYDLVAAKKFQYDQFRTDLQAHVEDHSGNCRATFAKKLVEKYFFGQSLFGYALLHALLWDTHIACEITVQLVSELGWKNTYLVLGEKLGDKLIQGVSSARPRKLSYNYKEEL